MTPFSPKPRACEHCRKPFVPQRMGQKVCGPVCAHRKVKADKAEGRAKVKTRKQALQTIPQLIAKAQIAFNAFIRARDRHKGCFVCGCTFTEEAGRVMHAGHVRSRGAAGHLRFHEDNCLGECEGCNGPRGAKPHEIKAGAIARIGQAAFDALEADNRPHKWTHDELRAITATYRAKLRELNATPTGEAP